MSILYINTGTSPNAGNGDVLRTAFWKVNQNFAYLSTLTSSGASTATITVSTINSSSQYANTVTNVTGLRFDEDSGFDVQDLGSGNVKVLMNSTFKYWNVDGNPGLVAEGLDTVNFITGNGIDIITNTSGTNKSITFAVTATFGFTGSQGDLGYTGSQGDIGYVGSQGDVGYVGSQGDIGFTGSQGDVGYVGSQGDVGFIGSQGYTGSQGDLGYTGSQGDIGYVGSQGDVGYVGSQGDLGYVGSIGIGFTGSQGDQGPIGPSGGPVGPQGDLGYVGSQGDVGYVGSQGDVGYVGSQGDVGYVGSQGDQGYVGSQGDQGYVGSQGDLGYVGSQGDLGYTGSIGYVGSQGSQGPSGGPIGFTGSQGVQGPIGITGFNGSQGDTGFIGSLGFIGSFGFIGSRGVQGPIGNIGPIGPQGNQGPIGNVGPSGGPIGFTGSQGVQGPSGGPIGPQGFTGSQGIQGPIGFAGSVGYIGSAGPAFDISTITNQLLFTNSNVTFYVVTGTHLIVAEEFEANFGSPGSAGYAFVDLGYDTGLFSPSDDVVDILARSGTVVRFQGSIEPEGFLAYVVPYGSVIPNVTLTHQLGSADRIWTQFYVNTASLQKLYIGSNIAITTQTNNLLLTISNNTWTFSTTGTIVFPDGSEQTTAYTGAGGTGTVDFTNISSDVLPSANLTYDLGSTSSQWRSLYVGTGTIYIGGIPLTVTTSGTLVVDGNPVTGGAVQPYIELTNSPFIVQPVVLGEPVTVTAAAQGTGASFDVIIGEGPTIESVEVISTGTGYTVGQRYWIMNFNIGGPDESSSIKFEVVSVGGGGGILTITNVAFVGVASNTTGTYSSIPAEYRASVFDEIDEGLVLTRGRNQGIYNAEEESEYDDNTYLSPLGTLWNADGWGTLIGLNRRSYTTWRSALGNQVGNNIIGTELVMHDTINDRYYKFEFTDWGQNNGAYSYTRTEVTDPNYFEKTDYGSEIDIFVEDDGEGSGIGITRGENQGIYNPYREEGWDSDISPSGTEWNIDGWDDLSDIESRTYTNFYNAYDGNLGNNVPGSRSIMYIPETNTYYAIQWIDWTQGGEGGGFSYLRYELDLTQLNEGVKFSDGTILKSAEGIGRVKYTASGGRRIEEAAGNSTVSVTEIITSNITTATSRSVVDSNAFWVPNTGTIIAQIINSPSNFGVTDYATIQFSLDNTTWYSYTGGYSSDPDEIGVQVAGSVTYNEGDTVYFRYDTGGAPQVWWDKNYLAGGGANFRGAIIDYHAFTGQATIIGTIHIVDDDGEENITHTEVSSGSTDSENDDLWLVQNEGTISYRRTDGEAKTLKIQWIAKVFYGQEYYDD